MRVYIRVANERIVVGVEAIGDYLHPEKRREMLRINRVPKEKDHRPPAADDGVAARAGRKSPPVDIDVSRQIGVLFKTARRHNGRFRVETERLRRSEKDPKRWVGKTTFFLEVPAALQRSTPKR